jgi:hypothetical protein
MGETRQMGLQSSEGTLTHVSAGGSCLSSGISAGAVGLSTHTWPLHMVSMFLCGTVTWFQEQTSQDSPSSNDGIRISGDTLQKKKYKTGQLC